MIFLVGLAATVVVGAMRVASMVEALEEAQLRFAQAHGVSVSSDIETSLRAGDSAGARAAIARANSLRSLIVAAYVDPDGTILYTTDLSLRGKPSTALPIAASEALFADVRRRLRGTVLLTEGDRELVSAFPVSYGSSAGAIRGASVGVALHVYDLRSDRRAAIGRALRGGAMQGLMLAAFSAGLCLYFRRVLIRRIDSIGRFVEAVERGDGQPVLRVGGDDELAVLARRLERMTAELDERADEVLRGRERYRALVESTQDWVWEIDRDGRFLFSCPTSTQVLGLEPSAVVGRTFAEFVATDGEDGARSAALLAALAGDEPFRLLVGVHCGATGRRLHLEHTASPVLDDDGAVVGFRGIARDITERRVLENELARAQKLEALGRLAGGMAHDFNNILTAILGNVDLARIAPGSDVGARALQKIETAAERAAALTGQLLSFSRRRIVQDSLFRPAQVIGSMANMLSRIVGEQYPISFQLRSERYVAMDQSGFEQIVMNLVVNARDAMPEGGEIHVACTDGEGAGGEVADGGVVAIEVRDTGVGIAGQDLEHIFDPLFTTRDEGTGLGLATVKSAVDQAGGRIVVQSTVGAGAKFSIELPAVVPPVDVAEQPTSSEPGAEGTAADARILLCEDQEALRALLATALRSAGYTVDVVRDGAEGLEAVAADPDGFDLLVTDIVMPRSNGGELARAFLAAYPDAPILFMSGYMSAIEGIDEEHFPRARFLTKPFRPQALIREVRRLLVGDRCAAGRGARRRPR